MRNLNENVSTGGSRRARLGVPQRVTASQADEIRKAARLASQPIPEPKERQQRKGVKNLPSGAVGPESKVLRGGYARTPIGVARAKLKKVRQEIQDASTNYSIPVSQSVRLHTRLEKLSNAIKNKKKWGVKQEEVLFLVNYLVEGGYVNSYESAIEVAENMSDDWIYSILYD